MASPGIAKARELLAKDQSRRSHSSVHPSSCVCDDCMVRRHLELAINCLEVFLEWVDYIESNETDMAIEDYEEATSEHS